MAYKLSNMIEWLVLVGVVTAASAACGSIADPALSSVECGLDTHREGNTCVADARDGASNPDAPPTPGLSDAGPETSADSGIDAGSLVRNGDPCLQGNRSACSGNRLFACQVVNNGTHPLGTLWEAANCSLLDGMCAVDAFGNGGCRGGGYTTCLTPRDDAGAPLDTRRCYSKNVLELCQSGFWSPTDCKERGLVCRASDAGTGASCVAP